MGVSTGKAGGWELSATAGLTGSQTSPDPRRVRMEEDIQAGGVHDVYTRSFRANTFSRVSLWINHELPPETAKKLEEAVAEAAIAAVKVWVAS